MKILFLDDRQERIDVAKERYKDDELTIVRTAQGAISELVSMVDMSTGWGLVCLDHDLGNKSFVDPKRIDCGMEVVRWMEEYVGIKDFIARKVVIHSSNLMAAFEMYSKLKARGYNVIYERFRYD